jgi:hypothetical protein
VAFESHLRFIRQVVGDGATGDSGDVPVERVRAAGG